MNELEQWKNDIWEYNKNYEAIELRIKEHSNTALKLLRRPIPHPDVATESAELSLLLERLVEVCAEASYNYRGVKNFYEVTLMKRKLSIMRNEEKKIAANVAEAEAVIASATEFSLMNEAERYKETSDKRYSATERLIESIHIRLNYGNKP